MAKNLTGQPIDYEMFKSEFDSNPTLKNLIQRFDGRGIVIKTKAKEKELVSNKPASNGNSDAQRAASATLKRPG
jgi:hypothetical protein